jgi:iron complex outermembrane receptor protein
MDMGIYKCWNLCIATSVIAVAAASPATGQEAVAREYHLPRQKLAISLLAIGQQTHTEILFQPRDVRHITAPALNGRYSAEEAVQTLLAPTNLQPEARNGAIFIRHRSHVEASDAASQSADIIVTGTHIRGAPLASLASTATRLEIQSEGLTNLGDFARTLVQNYSGGQNPGIFGGGQGSSENTTGSSALNLRGLGPDATLTLINSHRVAYDAISQGVDISSIPIAAIERVDIVGDGASALYGSDAVAGVANVILRRDFEGLQTSARFGAATDEGQVAQQYSAVTGSRWSSGGVMIAGDYQHATAITAQQRSYTGNIYPSTTLLPGFRQINLTGSGHQRLGDNLDFGIDGHFSDRHSPRCIAYFQTSACDINGNVVATSVQSYSLSPSLRGTLANGWEVRVAGTIGQSNSSIATSVFRNGSRSFVTTPRYDNRLRTIEINAEGPLASIGGGDIRLAVGAGYRGTTLGVDIKTIASGVTTSSAEYTQRQNVGFAYGELSVPLIGENNRQPFLESLRLSGALRYENYGSRGNVATPKLGIVYAPLPDITIKSSWGRSFKAPTLYQTGSASNAYLIPGFVFAPAPSGGMPVLLLAGGNPSLKAERASTWTVSVTLAPRAIAGFSLDAGFFSTHYRDRVLSPIVSEVSALGVDYGPLVILNPSAQQVLDSVAAVSGTLQNQTAAAYNPATVGAIIDDRLQNVAQQNIRGVDIQARYVHRLGLDEHLTFNGSASYLESERRNTPDQPEFPGAGTIFNPPHWRGRASAAWIRHNVTLTGVINYIGGTDDSRFQPTVRVASFTSSDAILTIRSAEKRGALANLEFQLGISNLFNEKPSPIRFTDPAAARFDSTNYPATGRAISISLTKQW